MTIISTTVGKSPLEGMDWSSYSRVWNAVLGCNLKNGRMILVCFSCNPFNIIVIQVCVQDLLELTAKKDVLFIIGDWNTEVGSQKYNWNNRQVWLWSIKLIRAKANRVLPREQAGHSKHLLPKTQETTVHMGITRWSVLKSDWLYSLQPNMEKLYIVSKNKTRSWLWLRSSAPYCKM